MLYRVVPLWELTSCEAAIASIKWGLILLMVTLAITVPSVLYLLSQYSKPQYSQSKTEAGEAEKVVWRGWKVYMAEVVALLSALALAFEFIYLLSWAFPHLP